jgi:hypothetical protein
MTDTLLQELKVYIIKRLKEYKLLKFDYNDNYNEIRMLLENYTTGKHKYIALDTIDTVKTVKDISFDRIDEVIEELNKGK